ncbi:MAG: GntR family transcriptional regulator [Planctomycetes bacterium]|nr:GntR family transcriptional regulator [Planctomycetota bacterium]MCD7897205.1 GntR family transcriptional regulator [Planctomycetaceae bacterium]
MDVKSLGIGPISKDLLYIKIVDAIHAHIRRNGLKPGDKLPSEREMAESFQTSRNSVREALRVMENQGMLEVKTGRGTFLRERGDENVSVSIGIIKNNFREIQELTHILDSACLRKAVERATVPERRKLIRLAEEMNDDLADGFFNEATDHAFHGQLGAMSGNTALAELARSLREEVFGAYWSCLDFDTNLRLETVPNHLHMARAVLDNDLARAQTELDTISRHTLMTMDLVERTALHAEKS